MKQRAGTLLMLNNDQKSYRSLGYRYLGCLRSDDTGDNIQYITIDEIYETTASGLEERYYSVAIIALHYFNLVEVVCITSELHEAKVFYYDHLLGFREKHNVWNQA